jgi:methylated-DNA-[protein]-cysteine S-methyltransferase
MSRSEIFQTPWGWMGMAASERGICCIVLPTLSRSAVQDQLRHRHDAAEQAPSQERRVAEYLHDARAQLMQFLADERRVLDFSLDLSDGTPFQRRVWRVILRIPYGRVRSYRWVADRVGGAHYARAVGNALGANPVPIIVPCHRVVTSQGSLGGFTGGLSVKRRLLELEGTFAQLHMGAR